MDVKTEGNEVRRGLLWAAMVCLVPLLSACGGNDVASHLAKAQKYRNQGLYRSAVIEYKNVLQKKPHDVAARLGLGQTYLANGDAVDAQAQLLRARKLGASPSQFTIPLAKSMVALGQYDKAISLLATKDSRLTEKQQAVVEVVRGDALLGQGKLDKARQAYSNALSSQPGLASALTGQARLEVRQKNWQQAQARVKQALASDPKSAAAWFLKGQLEYRNHKLKAAEAAFSKVASGQAKHDITPRLVFMSHASLADLHISQNKLEMAQKEVSTLLKAAPKQPLANYLQALIDVHQKKLDDAASHLQVAASSAPQNPMVLSLLGAVKLAQGDNAEAQMYLSSAVSLDPGNANTKRLLTEAQLHSGAGGSQSSVNDNAPKSLKSLKEQAAQSPDNAGLQMAYAQSLLEQGQGAQALSVLNKVPESQTSTGLSRDRLRIAALLRTHKLNAALSAVEDMLHAHPNDIKAYLLASDVYMLTNNNAKAQGVIRKALSLSPHSTAVQLKAAVLAIRDGKAQQARDYLLAIHKATPDNIAAIMGLARVSAMQGDNAQEIHWLDKARKAAPGNIAIDTILVRAYVNQHKPDKALTVAKNTLIANPDNGSALNLLAATQWGVGHKEEAVKTFEKAVTVSPDDMGLRINLARAQIATHHDAAAANTLQDAILQQPRNGEAYRMLAFLQLHKGNVDGAFKTAQKLSKQPHARLAAVVLKGDLYYAQKHYHKAAQAYEKVLSDKQWTSNRPLVLRDFSARVKGGVGQPQHLVQQWLKNHPEDGYMRTVLANWYLQKHDMDSAAREYQQAIASNPNDPGALNNLAWIYSQQNNPKARKLASKAYKLAPDNPSIADTLGWIDLKSGHHEKALKLLIKAAHEAPQSRTAHYHLAVAQARTGHKREARKTLKTLLAGKSNFPERQSAENLFKRISAE